MKTGVTYGIVPDASSSNRVRCVFCGVFIPKSNKCIEQHTNGTKHKENIDLLSENGIRFKDQVLYCRLCSHTLLDDESVSKHIDCDVHANWMTAMEDLVDGEFINLEPYLSCEKDDVTCEVCNKSIKCSPQKIEEHVNCFSHRANVCEKLKPLNGIFPVENTEELWCKICDAYIKNTVAAVLQHIDDDEQHVDWFDDMEDVIDDHDISFENYLANEHETKAYCSSCQAEINCDSESIAYHIASQSHMSNFG
ncbi:hypothetical protein NE865_07699 [Phthorimaea operculella]|nr:hypothetical protein NE865_07699 [Phthorimaea operculella]